MPRGPARAAQRLLHARARAEPVDAGRSTSPAMWTTASPPSAWSTRTPVSARAEDGPPAGAAGRSAARTQRPPATTTSTPARTYRSAFERRRSGMTGTLGGRASHGTRGMCQLCNGPVTSSSALREAAIGSSMLMTPDPMSHVPTPTTGRPIRSANAISESVPKPPPTATSASTARTMSALRSSPMPVAMAIETQGFAAERSSPGSSPMVVPPASRAPRQAARHHAAEAAADDDRAGAGELGPDDLGRAEVGLLLLAGADDGDVRRRRGSPADHRRARRSTARTITAASARSATVRADGPPAGVVGLAPARLRRRYEGRSSALAPACGEELWPS